MRSRLKMLRLAVLPLAGLVVAAGLAAWAPSSPLGGSSAAQATQPHITLKKEASLSPGGPFVGVFTFTFTITNDGNTPLIRWKAEDTTLGRITWEFPEKLTVGQTETVILTKLQVPGDRLCNWAEVNYRTESWTVVKAQAQACLPTPTPHPD